VLDKDPTNLDLKTKIAMTYVVLVQSHARELRLREVLAEEPTNEDGLFHMNSPIHESGHIKEPLSD